MRCSSKCTSALQPYEEKKSVSWVTYGTYGSCTVCLSVTWPWSLPIREETSAQFYFIASHGYSWDTFILKFCIPTPFTVKFAEISRLFSISEKRVMLLTSVLDFEYQACDPLVD